MGAVHEQGELGAGIDDVWKLVSDFGGFLEVMGMPAEVTGEGIGQTRTIAAGKEPMVERLEELDHDARRLVYSIVSGPMPATDYLSTMQLTPAGDGRTTLSWSCTFEPAGGLGDDDVANIIKGVYLGGIAALQGRFGA